MHGVTRRRAHSSSSSVSGGGENYGDASCGKPRVRCATRGGGHADADAAAAGRSSKNEGMHPRSWPGVAAPRRHPLSSCVCRLPSLPYGETRLARGRDAERFTTLVRTACP